MMVLSETISNDCYMTQLINTEEYEDKHKWMSLPERHKEKISNWRDIDLQTCDEFVILETGIRHD